MAYQSEEASRYYDAYLSLVPDDAMGHLGAGCSALALGDPETAAKHLDRSLELNPKNAAAHLERAKLDLSQGNQLEALRHFDKSIDLQPYEPEVRYSRKLALTRLGRAEEAAEEQQAIDRLKADLSVMENLQAKLINSPKDVAIEYQLARWMFAHGYGAEGVKWGQKILTDHPRHRDTCKLLSDYFERQGEPAMASRYRLLGR